MAIKETDIIICGHGSGRPSTKIMAESAPSALGRKHIDDVQKALQESVQEVKKAQEKANEQQKAVAINDAVIST